MSSVPYTIFNAIPSIPAVLYSAVASASKTAYQYAEDAGDKLQFLVEFFKDPLANGSIIPSSSYLTEKMIRFIPEKSPTTSIARRYLEVGAGTGSFTSGIVKRLNPDDTFDIVELNPSFCATLENKYSNHPNVHVHCLSITDWAPDEPYDAVISGLPLNAFPVELVEDCLDVFKKITKPGGTISYFEYPNISKICLKLYYGEQKARLEKVLEIKENFFNSFGFQTDRVTLNFPEAKVLHFKMGGSENDSDNKAPTVSTLSDAT